MGKRIDCQYIKKFIEEQNYTLLSTEFINAKTKLTIMCDKGHIFEMNWNNFQQGKRCPKCMIEISANKRRKTNEEFLQEVYLLVKDEYIFFEDYINNSTKIKLKHNTCGFEYKVTPQNFLSGERCPVCSGRGNFRTTDYLKNEINKITNGEYTLIGEYTKTIEKTKIKHSICGCIFKMSPNTFINTGSRCPICFGTLKKDDNIFKQEVYNLVGFEYDVLDEYINSKYKIMFKHNNCGFEFLMLPNSFLSGHRCPKCKGMYRTTDEFKKEVFLIFGDEYSVIGEYKGSNHKITMRHNICGHVYDVRTSHVLDKHGCPNCFRNDLKTNEQFLKEIYDLVEEEYTVLEKYKGANIKILFKHMECGNEYLTTPSNFFRGSRCPECNKSKGERKISDLLNINEFQKLTQEEYDLLINDNKKYYIPQKKFDNLVGLGGGLLSYDFYLPYPQYNLLIEYDGEFHYKPIKLYKNEPIEYAEERLKKQQYHDKLKNEYAENHNIILLRIPYWEYNNIEEILISKGVI